MRKRANVPNKSETGDNHWKRRPSEIRGYNRTLYTTTEDDEYIRVDYNLRERQVRLYIEDSEEAGNAYFSIITNGKVTVERHAITGRIANLSEKFKKRAGIFSSIPNKQVIKLIGKNYGIGLKSQARSLTRDDRKKRSEQKKLELEQIRRKYFGDQSDSEDAAYVDDEISEPPREKIKKLHIVDFVDFSVGLILCIGMYTFNNSFVTLGVLSAFIGIFLGLLDIYYRERQLILIKMLLFLLAGVIFYIYGYYIL